MDSIPLVEDDIADGQKIIDRLVQESFPLKAAAWVKETEGGYWYLYLVSPFVDRQGPLKAYCRIDPWIWELRTHPSRPETLEIKVVGAKDPVGKAIVAERDRYPGGRPRWLRENRLGELEIDAAYLYPPVSASNPPSSTNGVTEERR